MAVLGRTADNSFILGVTEPLFITKGKVTAYDRNHRMTPTLIAKVAEII
jgi:hypothetical protein